MFENSLKIKNWKTCPELRVGLKIALIALCFFSLSNQASAATIAKPSNFLTVNQGLVGYWTFDGPDMLTNVRDRSGQGNHGSLVGQTSTTSVQGKLGQALRFNGSAGSGDYVNIGDKLNTLAVPFTLSAWMYTNTPLGSTQGIVETDQGGSPSVYSGAILFKQITTGKVGVQYGDNTACSSAGIRAKVGTTVLTVGKWYHVVGVVRGATDMDIYVNGVDDGGSYSGSGGSMVNTTGSLRLGTFTDCSGTGNYSINGGVDDVRIYNRALSATEVKQLYNLGR